MKKEDIVNLIQAHYCSDPQLFFQTTLKILKELKANGDKEIVEHLDWILKGRVKIIPKQEEVPFNPEISFEDAAGLDWVPMMETQNE